MEFQESEESTDYYIRGIGGLPEGSQHVSRRQTLCIRDDGVIVTIFSRVLHHNR